MSTIAVHGISVAFDDEGSGDALVLVHGHPFDRSMWRPQIERFSRSGWRVIAPDLRGYGETTVVAGKTTLETFARDIAALLDELEIERIAAAPSAPTTSACSRRSQCRRSWSSVATTNSRPSATPS